MLGWTHASALKHMASLRRSLLIPATLLLAACQSSGPTKEELEAAKNTIDCDYGGERIIIRFAEGEARLLMPDGTRVVLYQVPVATGLRYTNGLMELRGTGLELQLARDRITMKATCKAYEIPTKKE
jgi:membrane-bound inhibitor of C-type lysozyme